MTEDHSARCGKCLYRWSPTVGTLCAKCTDIEPVAQQTYFKKDPKLTLKKENRK